MKSLLGLVVALAAGHAWACSCSWQVDSFPRSGASNVPTNVVIRVVSDPTSSGVTYRLYRTADHSEVTLEKRDGPGTRLISLRPATSLDANTAYELETTAQSGMAITFTTGSNEDHDVPTKAELKSAAYSANASDDSCGGRESWVLRVEGGDDATTARDELLLLVHGETSTSPTDAIGVSPLSDPKLTTAFCSTNFDPPEGDSFTLGIQVMDLAGNVSEVSSGRPVRASCAALPGEFIAALGLLLFTRRQSSK